MANPRNYSDRKKLLINLAATISSFVLNAAINFFLSPYIVHTLGVEANGYVQLASNIVSYISVITVALNSMSGRFITIALTKGETEKAVSYYTSVFWANIAVFGIMLFPIAGFIWKLEGLINITPELVSDVKLLFVLAFINLALSKVLSLWNNAYYATNTIFLEYARNMTVTFFRAVIILLLFAFFPPKVFYMTLASVCIVPISAAWSFRDKSRLLPDLRVNTKTFSYVRLKEIVMSGIWRSLQSTGEILLTGLDLLICNLFINPVAMGMLALSKTIPNMISQLNWAIVSAFSPKLTINYAQERQDLIWNDLKRSFKICSIIGTIPLGGMIIYGRDFFRLWVPGEDAGLLHVLSILSCFGMALVLGIQPVGNVFAVVNKVKPQAIAIIASGLLNAVVVLFAVRYTDWGIYAVSGSSVLIGLIRNLCYTLPASARCLGFKWHQFYVGVWYSVICTAAVAAAGAAIRCLIHPVNWKYMLLSCAITAAAAFIINNFIVFNRRERKVMYEMMGAVIKKVTGR